MPAIGYSLSSVDTCILSSFIIRLQFLWHSLLWQHGWAFIIYGSNSFIITSRLSACTQILDTLQYQQSIGGSVISSATGKAQARFPTNARVIVDQGIAVQCSPIMVCYSIQINSKTSSYYLCKSYLYIYISVISKMSFCWCADFITVRIAFWNCTAIN